MVEAMSALRIGCANCDSPMETDQVERRVKEYWNQSRDIFLRRLTDAQVTWISLPYDLFRRVLNQILIGYRKVVWAGLSGSHFSKAIRRSIHRWILVDKLFISSKKLISPFCSGALCSTYNTDQFKRGQKCRWNSFAIDQSDIAASAFWEGITSQRSVCSYWHFILRHYHDLRPTLSNNCTTRPRCPPSTLPVQTVGEKSIRGKNKG